MKNYLGIILFVWLVSGCGEKNYVMVDRTDGYKGAAKLNPYLAAQTLLREEHEYDVKVKNGFVRYDYNTGMVISPSSALGSEIMIDKMLRWVKEDGGVYVCLLERGEKRWTDVGESCEHVTEYWTWKWDYEEAQTTSRDYLLEKMGIELEDDPSGKTTGGESYHEKPKNPVVLGEELPLVETVTVEMDGFEHELQIGGTKVMKLNRPLYQNDISDEGEYHRFLGLEHGEGRIYFITDGRLFRNPYLTMSDHAAVLDSMRAEVYYGDIVFGYGNRRGFWALMINHAGPALLGVFALLVFWLWKSIPRFGPLLEIPDGHARDYAQSVSNTGRFLWKYKSSGVLLTALRENLLRTSGMFDADGQAEESLIENLAEKSGVEVEEVVEALTREEINEAGDMVRITKNLQTMLKSL